MSKPFTFFQRCILLLLVINTSNTIAILNNPIDRISNDYLALTRKVTAHHILLPKSVDAALALKQKIRNRVNDKERPAFVVDAFSAAAKRFSLDKETASRGGLLGHLVPQGYCRSAKLDEACFVAPIGEITGPIESEYGCHLILVSERINCQKFDGVHNKIERGEDGVSSIFTKSEGKDSTQQVVEAAVWQIGFWMVVILMGSMVAELSAEVATLLPIN